MGQHGYEYYDPYSRQPTPSKLERDRIEKLADRSRGLSVGKINIGGASKEVLDKELGPLELPVHLL